MHLLVYRVRKLTLLICFALQITVNPPYFNSALSAETNKLSCPPILDNFLLKQKSECEILNRRVIKIKPLQGFGNQLNGILQGVFIAAISNRCLQIDWKYTEVTDSIFKIETVKHSKVRTESTKIDGGSLKYKTISFPRKISNFEKNLNILKSGIDLQLLVHYRDRLCHLLRSANRIFFSK